MNTEALFLFLILLLGLLLCSFLGGNCGKEGLQNNNQNNVQTTSETPQSTSLWSEVSSALSNYDNYNHYTGSSSSGQLQNGMVFTDPSGDTITVITNSDGSLSLQITSQSQSTPLILSSTPPSNSNIQPQSDIFYAPYGGITANIVTDNNGQIAINVNIGSTSILFVQSGSSSTSAVTNSNTTTNTQYYGSTGYPIQSAGYSLAYNGPYGNNAYYAQGPYGGSAGYATGPYGNTAYYAQGPYGNTVAGTIPNQYNTPSAGSVTGPYGNTAYYAQGPYGNTVAGTTNNNEYYSTLPPGIPASQIPPGQEDLYILKSEIVPPVCPACPTNASCPRQEPCPPCPACARCPEPSFECKKVPNYNAINNDFLPAPVLNDFSQFGM
jgi:hypothetical protein